MIQQCDFRLLLFSHNPMMPKRSESFFSTADAFISESKWTALAFSVEETHIDVCKEDTSQQSMFYYCLDYICALYYYIYISSIYWMFYVIHVDVFNYL